MTLHLGFGLYHHQLTEEHMRFAKQCGATHAVVHLVDYFNQGSENNQRSDQPIGDGEGWGIAGATRGAWNLDNLLAIKQRLADNGLTWHAIENFDPADWYDVLLDGPQKAAQLERLGEIIRMVGDAGIPVFGYNFSLAGVAVRNVGPFARGGAESVGLNGLGSWDDSKPGDNLIWNMQVEESRESAPNKFCSSEELWSRLSDFLEYLVPIAEAAGVRLAAHPDDPPMPTLRGTPRLVHQPELYQKLLDIASSKANALEFCLGTVAEMPGCKVLDAVEKYASQGAIGYVHCRNVRGQAPDYQEVFIDEGDIDIPKVMDIIAKHGHDVVFIPDHAPQMTCDAPWHAGMAYAMGYLKAQIQRCNA